MFSPALEGSLWDAVQIRLVGLAQISGVGERYSTFLTHPMNSNAGIQPSGKGYSDFLPHRDALQDMSHMSDDLLTCQRLLGSVFSYVARSLAQVMRESLTPLENTHLAIFLWRLCHSARTPPLSYGRIP